MSSAFYRLTQNETLDLTDERLKQFLYNILSNKSLNHRKKFFKKAANVIKEKYSFEDFNNINIDWDEILRVTEPIGQTLVAKKRYPFIANPYNNTIIDEFLLREGQNIITTQNAYLYLNFSR